MEFSWETIQSPPNLFPKTSEAVRGTPLLLNFDGPFSQKGE
jgi:hypothetical protein